MSATDETRIEHGNCPFLRHQKLACFCLTPHIFHMLPDEQPSPEQIAALRAMSGEKRLRIAMQLYWSARRLKTAGVRAQHPDWTEEQVKEEVRRIYFHART